MRRFTSILTVLIGIFPLTFGVRFLFDGSGAATGYGVTASAGAYFAIKGIRDIALGLNVLTLFALGHRRATGIVLAVTSIVPFVDAAIVLTHGGSLLTALFVHVLTALVLVFDAVLLLRERTATPEGASSRMVPAAQ